MENKIKEDLVIHTSHTSWHSFIRLSIFISSFFLSILSCRRPWAVSSSHLILCIMRRLNFFCDLGPPSAITNTISFVIKTVPRESQVGESVKVKFIYLRIFLSFLSGKNERRVPKEIKLYFAGLSKQALPHIVRHWQRYSRIKKKNSRLRIRF